MTTKTLRLRRLIASAICLALALVLPFLTGQLQQFGNMLCPMHIPVLLCGILCGWPWGLAVGFIAPLLRFVLFGAPVIYPIGLAMAFELATYGFSAGLCYKLLPKTPGYVYAALLCGMIDGRIVWGLARYIMAGLSGSEFPFSAFLAGAVTNAIPGIILQLVLIPILVLALKKAGIGYNE